MGMYLNPGRQSFEEAVNSEIYVDKTEMLRLLNALVGTKQRYVSVSRPRRFGKTMAADMICAYYDRTSEARVLFGQTRLASSAPVLTARGTLEWDGHLGRFDVVRLVMTDFLRAGKSVGEGLAKLTERILEELADTYPGVRFDKEDLPYSMGRYYQSTGTQFVIVIDEWDAVFRQRRDDSAGQREYLDFLRDWLKDRPYVALAYMTGVLPIKKYGAHSALNMFEEYSMIHPMRLAKYTGFTEAEVRELCDRYEMDYEVISRWYDGYRLSDYVPIAKRRLFRAGSYQGHKLSVYSPLSVVRAMQNGIVDNYWNKTETYEALADYIRMDFDGLKSTVALLMDGGRAHVSLDTYQNDMSTFHGKDDILALLIHLGYLGFEGEESAGKIESERGEVFIPNNEILEEFKASTRSPEWEQPLRAFEKSKELLRATWNRDSGRVAELLEEAHDQAANKTYSSEAALSYAVQLAYYAAQRYYTTVLELDSGKGYADVAYLPAPRHPEIPALVVELKYGKAAGTALDQIRRRDYPARLEHYQGNILLVAISYDRNALSTDPAFKRHTCIIEEA